MKYNVAIGEVDGVDGGEIEVEADNPREAWKNAFEDCEPHEIPLCIYKAVTNGGSDDNVVYNFDSGFYEEQPQVKEVTVQPQ